MQRTPNPSGNHSSKRGTVGKRKSASCDTGDDLHQSNISELFSSSSNATSSSTKRRRTSVSPVTIGRETLKTADKMYNFSTTCESSKASDQFPRKIGGPSVVSRQSNFTPHTGAKRLVVKNLRTGSRLNQDEYFDSIWSRLSTALETIFAGGKPATSIEELYKGAENVCRQGRAAVLAKKLQECCQKYIVDYLRRDLVDSTKNQSNVDALRAVVDAWVAWNSKLVSSS